MKFFKMNRRIRTEEDGAVTVDWVVLTAAVCGLAAIGLVSVKSGTSKLAGKIGTALSAGTATLN